MDSKMRYPVCLWCVLSLLFTGCAVPPRAEYRTLTDFRRAFPKSGCAEFMSAGMLSLSAAMRTALANNPDYISAYYAVRAAKYRYYQSLSAYLPRVDFDSTAGQYLEDNYDILNPPPGIFPHDRHFSAAGTLRVSWLIFDGLEREFAALIAQKGFDSSQQADRNVRRLLLRAVAYAYYDAILARESERIALADMEFQTSSLLQAENRYRNGHVSKAAVLNFKILANQARSDLENARYRGEAARYSLSALMGFSTEKLPDSLSLSPLTLRFEPMPFDLTFYLNEALANRPDLQEFRLLLEIARFRKYSAWSQFFPVISAYAGYRFSAEHSRYHDNAYESSHYHNSHFNYGVQGMWNVFSGFSTVNLIRERVMLESAARFRLERSFLDVVSEVKTAFANYTNAARQVMIYHETLQWVFEQRRLVASEYWSGKETITRLNGAQSDLVNAEGKLAIALAEMNKAIAQLRAAVNYPLEEELIREYPHPASGVPLEKLLNALEERFP